MTNAQLEAWVLAIVESVTQSRRVEDARVELKAQWPDPEKAARRLAGHANAARGAAILWLIGLDEGLGGSGSPPPPDTASWYPQVAAEFDGVSPGLHDLVVPTPQGNLVALLFETSRAPYVVRNPNFGRAKGEAIAWEVPWREGTRIRTATRSDLLRVLVPVLQSPHLEVLKWTVSLHEEPGREDKFGEHIHPAQLGPHLQWDVILELYVTPRSQDLLVLPVHRTTLAVKGRGFGRNMERLHYWVPYVHLGSGMKADSHTITRTNSEAIISGPGVLHVQGSLYEHRWEYEVPAELECELLVAPAGTSDPIRVALSVQQFAPPHRQPTHVATWGTEGIKLGA